MLDLLGKAALVTGGSRGIGAGIARRLAMEGADVAITYLRASEKAAAVVAEIEAFGRGGVAIQSDSAEPSAVEAAVETAAEALGRLDILINNAGIFPFGPIGEVTGEELDRALAIHARAPFIASRTALRFLGSGGRIISIGSSLAWRVPTPGVTLYAMTKSALIGFTRGLAQDVAPRGITVNVIDPGSTDTDMNPAGSEAAETERAFIPLGHYGTPDDVAAMAAFLAGPGGRYITGASIPVDGGATI